MLHINDLTFRIGGTLLFDRATAHIPAGRKVGLIGRNGAGKSTLLALITGALSPDGGDVAVRPRARVTTVAQEAPAGDRTPIEAVLDADTEMRTLEREAARTSDPHRLAEIHTRLADIGAHSAEARASAILAGLGFDEQAQAQPLDRFSGGWRMRVGLAAALFAAPELLLLDEPTNYLDLEGVIWLESFLAKYPYTAIVVSHDRSLLNRAVDSILHLEGGKLALYKGGYDAFEARRSRDLERQAAMKSRQDAERRRIQAFVDRFRAKASKARQAQSRLKMLERMAPIPGVVENRTIPFSFPKPDPLSPPLISLEEAAVGYNDGTPVLRGLDLRIDPDDRTALLGANGEGKSTFAKLLSGRLAPMAGKLVAPRTLKVGYFAQHQLDELRAAETPFQHLARLMPDQPEVRVRARLGAFGFSADKADRAVETLSGGEKARLLFALAAAQAPQLLILDEPTNHLDIDSREALIRALNEFDGALILISHDERLTSACADRLWLVGGGRVRRFEGDIEDYRRKLLRERGGRGKGDEAAKGESPRKNLRRTAAEKRARTAPLRRALESAEADVEALTAQRARIEKALENPALYDGTLPGAPTKIAHLRMEQTRLEEQIATAEETWLQAQAALEMVQVKES